MIIANKHNKAAACTILHASSWRNILTAVSRVGIGGNTLLLDREFHRGECRGFKAGLADVAASVAVRARHSSTDS